MLASTLPSPAAVLMHRYSFNGTAADSVGDASWTGTLGTAAKISGGQLQLPGGSSSSYLQLPAGILGSPAPSAVSIEMWITTASTGNSGGYNRIFQFGSHTTGIANEGNPGSLVFSRNSGNNGFQLVSYGTVAPTQTASQAATTADTLTTVFNNQTNLHVVINLYNGGYGWVYINGLLVGSTQATGLILPIGSPGEINLIGLGTDYTVPGMVGSVDEFRIWSGVLSLPTILNHNNFGPNQNLGRVIYWWKMTK